jgi:hypothetical protein
VINFFGTTKKWVGACGLMSLKASVCGKNVNKVELVLKALLDGVGRWLLRLSLRTQDRGFKYPPRERGAN